MVYELKIEIFWKYFALILILIIKAGNNFAILSISGHTDCTVYLQM